MDIEIGLREVTEVEEAMLMEEAAATRRHEKVKRLKITGVREDGQEVI